MGHSAAFQLKKIIFHIRLQHSQKKVLAMSTDTETLHIFLVV